MRDECPKCTEGQIYEIPYDSDTCVFECNNHKCGYMTRDYDVYVDDLRKAKKIKEV